MLALQGEIERLRDERAATPEEARRANVALRRLMRTQNNYFPELEEQARRILAAVDHPGGPLTQRTASDIAAHLGFTLHYVPDLPQTTRSVADIKNGRLYLSSRLTAKGDPRTAVLQALSSRILGHREPTSYAEFLRQRVETNYLTGALLIPEAHAVPFLQEAKGRPRDLDRGPARRVLGVVRDRRAPLHESRDGASRHPGALPQGARVGHDHEGVRERRRELPDRSARRDRGADVLPAVDDRASCSTRTTTSTRTTSTPTPATARTGARPGSRRRARARTRSASACASTTRSGSSGATPRTAGVSKHSVEVCCRRAPADLEAAWRDNSWPNVRTPRTLLATLPTGAFPGVDTTDVYEFLEAHAPR